ncbi:MAG: baseplate J/gp47 family protein [Clostridiaceae bacterium]
MSNEILFVEVDAEKINSEMISDFEDAYGETLYPSDERRIFLQQLTQVIVCLKNDINGSAKQNLLRYAKGDLLDALGEFYKTPRLTEKKATVLCRITLSTAQSSDLIISKNNRITPDGVLFFALENDVTIPAGELYVDAIFEATEAGSKYNGFTSGQIKTIVDNIPYVNTIQNIETSKGGSERETDDRYRERIGLAPESFSVAGPEGAYEYFAKSADVDIVDTEIITPSPGVVKIIVLMKNGAIPSQDVLDKVITECTPKNRRPLTDNVQVGAPTVVTYDINLTYFLDKEHSSEELNFRKSIEGEKLDCSTGAIRDYINWLQEKLGRTINSDELRYRIQNAASYTASDNKSYTVVRRMIINSPSNIELEKTEVAKIGTITVTYGGLE